MKKTLNKLTLAATGLTLPVFALAAPPQGVEPVGASAGDMTVGELLTKVIEWILLFAAAVAVLFLILGGLQYVTSAGNKDRIEKAKQTILYAVIGLIVIALSYVIVTFIGRNIREVV